MSFSWFFGSSGKKKSEAGPSENTQETQSGEYVFIERTVRNEEETGATIYPNLPYAVTPQAGTQSSGSNNITNVTQNQNFLFGVPFKLSSDIIFVTSDASMNIVQANHFLSYITQLNMETFDYDFRVEKSV
ncbi:hypothetical protein L9F63_015163 [Diploptera punctata]|uniref:UMA domain-containing protein n=1 Tax=Diploptera punctata TaxID=6984 RepID=A0AAD8A8K1_DIPPU|nr:hypothetical protein L9F63_015163 [Diploptera punctata]